MKQRFSQLCLALAVLFGVVTLAGCGGDDSKGGAPSITIEPGMISSTTFTFQVVRSNADHIYVLASTKLDAGAESANSVKRRGERRAVSDKVTIEGLEPQTNYVLYVLPCAADGTEGQMQRLRFETYTRGHQLYDWEMARGEIPYFTDMVLCYGGSKHRPVYRWNEDRFAPMVTYTDRDGKKHWLFDSFLFIEFTLTDHTNDPVLPRQYSYCIGAHKWSAGKAQWAELIDYWFNGSTGFTGLENAVRKAAQTLGEPPKKRYVVMTLPDPIVYELWSDETTSTTYWGELNGRTLNFEYAEDRVEAAKWFIDEVRARFAAKKYKYIELAGFYHVPEEIVTKTNGGWGWQYKRHDESIPPITKYLHSCNECFTFIPYYRAYGYAPSTWATLGVDYCYMQPNYYWPKSPRAPILTVLSDIDAQQNLGLEFEYDEFMVSSHEPDEEGNDYKVYQERFRDYMRIARDPKLYGKRLFAYYQGDDAHYQLAHSNHPDDQAIYHDLCELIINNPLRNKQN